MKRVIIVPFALGFLLLSGIALRAEREADVAAASDVGARRGEEPQRVEAASIVAPGVVEPMHGQVALGFEVSGTIVEILVDEGDHVESGQILARLDDRIARARVLRAEALLASARARRDMIVRGARPEEILAAEAEAEASNARARAQEKRRARVEALVVASAATPEDLDRARGSADSTRAAAEAAGARLALVRAGTRTEARREANALALAAEAELEEARTHLSQTEIRAPRRGVILRRLAEPGEHVTMTPPRTVLTMADLHELQLRVEIDEADIGRIRLGTRGFATADAWSKRRFGGRLVRMTRELGRKTLRADDPRARTDTRVLEVAFRLDDLEDLPLGLRMDVHLEDGGDEEEPRLSARE